MLLQQEHSGYFSLVFYDKRVEFTFVPDLYK